jgi:uncharacterized membrane protein
MAAMVTFKGIAMTNNPQSTFQIAGHPLHPLLVPLPITLLVTAFVCDLAYWLNTNSLWATAAIWALGAGIMTAALAATGGLIDFLGDRRIRDLSDAWYHFLANGTAVVVAIVNFYVRYRYGAEAGVFPWGIGLSLVTVLLLLFSGWKGGELVFRYRVGVLDDPRM